MCMRVSIGIRATFIVTLALRLRIPAPLEIASGERRFLRRYKETRASRRTICGAALDAQLLLSHKVRECLRRRLLIRGLLAGRSLEEAAMRDDLDSRPDYSNSAALVWTDGSGAG